MAGFPSEMVVGHDVESMISRACNGYLQSPDIGLNLDIAELVKTKTALAKKAAEKVLRIVTDEIDRQAAYLAVNLLDCLMVNCGYSVRFILSRKENLNLLVERFPPTPSFELDQAMKRTLKLIRKWKLTLCDKSRHKKDFFSISMMHDLLQSKGFIFPPISNDEIDAMVGLELQTLRTKESLEAEVKQILETKLEYFLARGSAADIKRANDIMQQMIALNDPSAYSQADSQIGQDLQKFGDKLVILEDLILKGTGDSVDVEVLMENGAIEQMYRTCRDELPKLLQLANSNLNETLMKRLISLTERIASLKAKVEGPDSSAAETPQPTKAHHSLALTPSMDHISGDVPVFFDDLPKLAHAPTGCTRFPKTIQSIYSGHNEHVFVDVVDLGGKQHILRVLNIADKALEGLKCNGSLWCERLVSGACECRRLEDTQGTSILSFECDGMQSFRVESLSSEHSKTDDLLLL